MDPRRRIPAVDRVLDSAALASLGGRFSRERQRAAVEAVQRRLRERVDAGGAAPDGIDDPEWQGREARSALERADRPSLRRVVNATGVVLHTNLGRAPLADAARDAILATAGGYLNLEFDLEAGSRGSRYDHCVALLRELTGAEDALVVNNNAAAVVLALDAFARGREAVISRGELVEIGGSFRVPDIMQRSGATLVEVGSTNRTHPGDYEAAVGPRTGAILKVHRSNFRITGFTADVPVPFLAGLARKRGVRLIHDLGSGLLMDPERLGLPPEPTAAAALAEGPDVVTLSGDKLLGGPQAGIVLGSAEAVAAMRADPLCRSLRVGRLTLAALEATLALYREPDRALREIPTLRMLSAAPGDLRVRAEGLARALEAAGVACELRDGFSAVGGGAYPGVELPTTLVAVHGGVGGPDALLARLRDADPPVVARIQDDAVVFDCRTLLEGDDALLVRESARALAG